MDVNEIILKNEYLIKSNISRHFYNFSNNNKSYDDLMQEGYIAIWKAYTSYKDIGKNDFKYYASRCIFNRLSSYVKSKNNCYEGKHLEDVINSDKDGNMCTMEDIVGSWDDVTDIEENSKIREYIESNKESEEILNMLIEGYNQKEIADKLNMKYRTLNYKVNNIKKDINNLLDFKIEKNKKDGRLLAIGEGFRKEFNSIKECSKFVDSDPSVIRKICQKVPHRHTCYSKSLNMKLKFEWIE